MGRTSKEGKSSIRLSINRFTSKEEIAFAAGYIIECVNQLLQEEAGFNK
jgi:cysteine sulfinate desulfinase/cysteine desulfurase-like protein